MNFVARAKCIHFVAASRRRALFKRNAIIHVYVRSIRVSLFAYPLTVNNFITPVAPSRQHSASRRRSKVFLKSDSAPKNDYARKYACLPIGSRSPATKRNRYYRI